MNPIATTTPIRFFLPVLFVMGSAGAACAATLAIEYTDLCVNGDALHLPETVEEIGFGADEGGPFSADASLDALDLGFGDPVYSPTNDPFVSDRVVAILNTSGRAFAEVWYVADASTSLTNWDGVIELSGGSITLQTFKIDAEGVNQPLLYESMINDGIWQPGEVWEFVIQDYQNSEVSDPAAFGSLGLDSAPGSDSSGSVVVTLEPETILSVELESRLERGGASQNPVIYFNSEVGVRYVLQSSPDLHCWTDLATIMGTGAERGYEDERGFANRRFYRITLEQNP